MAVLKFKNEKNEWEEYKVVNDGVTFIPAIDDKGNLTWSNNGHLDNPQPINIMGDTLGMYDSVADFPPEGEGHLLYIDKSTNIMYRWDTINKKYVMLYAGGGGGPASDWNAINNKPFSTINAKDFSVLSDQLNINSDNREQAILDTLKNNMETEDIDFSKF